MRCETAELVLYFRYGCHLCDEMLERLRELEKVWGFRLLVKDVDADPELALRFNDKVPVLERAGSEICRYVLDEEALGACVQTRKPEGLRRSDTG